MLRPSARISFSLIVGFRCATTQSGNSASIPNEVFLGTKDLVSESQVTSAFFSTFVSSRELMPWKRVSASKAILRGTPSVAICSMARRWRSTA